MVKDEDGEESFPKQQSQTTCRRVHFEVCYPSPRIRLFAFASSRFYLTSQLLHDMLLYLSLLPWPPVTQ